MAWKPALALLMIVALIGCVPSPAPQAVPLPRTTAQDRQDTARVASGAAPRASSGVAMPIPSGRIVALGDSLTAGYGVPGNQSYPAQLETLLRKEGYNYTVVNMGRSGETSAGALARVDTVIAQRPDIVLLAIGANDALQLADPNATKATIGAIIARLQERNITVVLAGSPQVIVQGWEYPGDFTRIYGDLAQEKKLIYDPSFLVGVAGNESLSLQDRVHPNAQGYAIIAHNMLPYAIEAIKERQGRTAS